MLKVVTTWGHNISFINTRPILLNNINILHYSHIISIRTQYIKMVRLLFIMLLIMVGRNQFYYFLRCLLFRRLSANFFSDYLTIFAHLW